ncbi:MAG: DUF2784 domain-containing protein [Aquabacterium sp.]
MRLLLADLILLLHAAIAAFVVAALPLIVIGNLRRWPWVNGLGFRLAHLAAIAVVAGQALLGVTCPLTTLESWLRQTGGGTGYGTGFIEYWVGRALFYSAPTWVFTTAYSAYAVLVAWAWWACPPARRRGAAGAGR